MSQVLKCDQCGKTVEPNEMKDDWLGVCVLKGISRYQQGRLWHFCRLPCLIEHFEQVRAMKRAFIEKFVEVPAEGAS